MKIQNDIMTIRRRIAIVSFISILVVLFGVLGMIYFGDEKLSDKLLSGTGIISPIILALTGIIAQYAHTSSQHDKIILGAKDDNKQT